MLSLSTNLNLEAVDKKYRKLLRNKFNQEAYSYLVSRISNQNHLGRFIFDNESMTQTNDL
jgi:hypothetical protein